MQVTIPNAAAMVEVYLQCGLVPFLHGSPGIGKTEVIHQIAEKYNLKLIDVRLGQSDPVDMNGLPFPDEKSRKVGYLPFDTFPVEGDSTPAGYSGWLLFLDEMNSAPQAVQAAAYKLILDRKVGQRKLHKNVAIAAAGNLITDGAIVEEMSTALQSRLAHIEVTFDSRVWLDWATANGIDRRITSYGNFRPDNLFSFKPDHTDKTFACPRTWSFVDRVLKKTGDNHQAFMPLIAGLVGDGVGTEFCAFAKIEKDLPKVQSIELNPTGIVVPEEPSVLWMLCGALSEAMNEKNADPLMRYIDRMPQEFQIVAVREAARRQPKLNDFPPFLKWVTNKALVLY